MSEDITQMRLAMRLDTYLREYTGKSAQKDTQGWDTIWLVADTARTNNMLTPELVDDVRKKLKNL